MCKVCVCVCRDIAHTCTYYLRITYIHFCLHPLPPPKHLRIIRQLCLRQKRRQQLRRLRGAERRQGALQVAAHVGVQGRHRGT